MRLSFVAWMKSRSGVPVPQDREHQTTGDDVATLLETFSDYVNPAGEWDPWFTLTEINQQFAWDDIPDDVLAGWLDELHTAAKVAAAYQNGEMVWRWLS